MCRLSMFLASCLLSVPLVAPYCSIPLPSLGARHFHSICAFRQSLCSKFYHTLVPLRFSSLPDFSSASRHIRKPQATSLSHCQASLPSFEQSPEWEGLAEWVRQCGGWVSPSIAAGSTTNGERGLFALSNTNGALAFVPYTSFIMATEGKPVPPSVSTALGGYAQKAGLETQLAVQVLLEAKDKTSRFAPYLTSLPPPAAFSHHPIMWETSELDALEDVALVKYLKDDKDKATKVYAELEKAGTVHRVTFEEWMWAVLIVKSRTYGWVDDSGTACMALEPIVDLLNHVRFSYIRPGEKLDGSAAIALKDMPNKLGEVGCAVLYALEEVKAGHEAAVSYRDLEVGGVLSASECMRTYGFVLSDPTKSSDSSDWGYALGSPTFVEEEASARAGLASMVDEAVKEGVQGKEELLQVVVCRFAAQLARQSLSDIKDMSDSSSCISIRLRTAASYRLARRMALGKAATRMLPAKVLGHDSVKQAVREACGSDESFMQWFWPAFTRPPPVLDDASAALQRLTQGNVSTKTKTDMEARAKGKPAPASSKGFSTAKGVKLKGGKK